MQPRRLTAGLGLLLTAVTLSAISMASALRSAAADDSVSTADWRPQHLPEAPSSGPVAAASGTEDADGNPRDARSDGGSDQPITRVTEGIKTLPNDDGQVWREYDISPYTSRVTNSPKPQQALIDWILRETGTEVWFQDPLGILSAGKQKLRVYHKPEIQQVVSGVVDQFVGSKAEPYTFGLRLVTIRSPNWRTIALPYLHPITVRTPGIEAWLLAKEDAALLLAELRKRNDYREHSASNLVIHNGQTSDISLRRPRNFIRTVRLRPDVWPGYEVLSGQVDEGFSLEFSPLLSLDGNSVDAVLKAEVDQIEKIVPVTVYVPTLLASQQQLQLQIPQVVSWRLHERFRWPVDKVLLISAGVVATPGEGKPGVGIPLPTEIFSTGPPRADGLLFVECKGKSSKVLTAPTPQTQGQPRTAGQLDTRGRY